MKSSALKPAVRNAIMIGGMCSISYFAVYIARNMLSSTSAQMEETGAFSLGQLGTLSSVYFFTYACGQLINGWIGDRIKAKYMISFGLMFAGIFNAIFASTISPTASYVSYGMSGFFLSMIYGPMTKVVAENTEPIYATRCSLGYTFASLLGTPAAGFIAVLVAWKTAFRITSVALLGMGAVALFAFSLLEKTGIIANRPRISKEKKGGGIRVLLKRQIVKFTIISIVTGVVRTAVIFWLPTYLSQHLHFSPKNATLIYTASTFIISFTSFIAVFFYELLRRNMNLSLLIYFSLSTVGFLLLFVVTNPGLNIVVLILAIMAGKAADSLMWCSYCPSLHDTGMVSTATGYLDFISYMAAAASSSLFANAVKAIGWNGLILIWMGLMAVGVVVCLPHKKTIRKHGSS